jgi:hypothetical protein
MTFGARPMSSSIFANFSLKSAVIHQSVCPNERGVRAKDDRNDHLWPTADVLAAGSDVRFQG